MSCNTYSSNAQEIDAFVHAHRDALVVVAAGNEGLSAASQTVGAPATAKNALAVGYLERCASASWEAYQFVDPNAAAGCGSSGGLGCCGAVGGCTLASCCSHGVARCCAPEYSSAEASGMDMRGGNGHTLQYFCDTLQHPAKHCSTLRHTATLWSTLQYTAMNCNTLQHAITHCNTLHNRL